MINQASFFRLSAPVTLSDSHLDQFLPTLPTQEKSVGWIAPGSGALIEHVFGAQVLKFAIETRKVPASAVQKELDARCLLVEQITGHKHGRAGTKRIKEDVILSLLPKAFPVQRHVTVIIDDTLLIIGSASASQVDAVLTALVKSTRSEVLELRTNTSPAYAMAEWLTAVEPGHGFEVGKQCELRATDESNAKVRYTNHNLLTDEVQTHIAQGKKPISLALSFNDRVCFSLTGALTLKKIGLFEDASFDAEPEYVGDMAVAAIAIGELRPLIAGLIEALGGEHA